MYVLRSLVRKMRCCAEALIFSPTTLLQTRLRSRVRPPRWTRQRTQLQMLQWTPAADLADQVGWQRWRTFPCEMEGLFTDFLTYCSRKLRLRPATNRTAMRTNLRLATGGRTTVQGLQSVRGASKKCKLTDNPDSANVELLP